MTATVRQVDRVVNFCATRCGLFFPDIALPVLARRDEGFQKGMILVVFPTERSQWKGHVCSGRALTFFDCGVPEPYPVVGSELALDLEDVLD